MPAGDGPVAGPADGGRLVVLCDTYERLAPLDDWVRSRLLPRLPASAVTVVAGRAAPGPAWRADPAWREMLRVISLRNLTPDDSRQYLHACGVDPARHDQLVESAHGHPLGLSLMADLSIRGGESSGRSAFAGSRGRGAARSIRRDCPQRRSSPRPEVCAIAG